MDLKDVLINCDGYNFVEDRSFIDRTLTLEELIQLCEELYYENQKLEKEIQELEENIQENYIKRPMSDYTGSFEDDRY